MADTPLSASFVAPMLLCTPQVTQTARTVHPHYTRASAGGKGRPPRRVFRPARGNNPRDYESFDGSQPLLPPWQPSSLEEAFTYAASRVERREKRSEPPMHVVRVVTANHSTLFAAVVQHIDAAHRPPRVWLRPLLLDGRTGFIDLRGASDLLLDTCFVKDDVDARTSTSLRATLAATEPDLASHTTEEDPYSHVASTALVEFLKTLRQPPSEEPQSQ